MAQNMGDETVDGRLRDRSRESARRGSADRDRSESRNGRGKSRGLDLLLLGGGLVGIVYGREDKIIELEVIASSSRDIHRTGRGGRGDSLDGDGRVVTAARGNFEGRSRLSSRLRA